MKNSVNKSHDRMKQSDDLLSAVSHVVILNTCALFSIGSAHVFSVFPSILKRNGALIPPVLMWDWGGVKTFDVDTSYIVTHPKYAFPICF